MPATTSQCMATFLCHIDDVGYGECDKSGRQRGAKRATARAAMAMATMVAGDKEVDGDGGKSDGDGDEGVLAFIIYVP